MGTLSKLLRYRYDCSGTSRKTGFRNQTYQKILDESPVLSNELLRLTEWIHKFYFCSWGEVIQAALPSGLNFVSNTFLQVNSDAKLPSSADELKVIDQIREQSPVTQKKFSNNLEVQV